MTPMQCNISYRRRVSSGKRFAPRNREGNKRQIGQREITKMLRIHQRWRFDPSGICGDEKDRLAQMVE